MKNAFKATLAILMATAMLAGCGTSAGSGAASPAASAGSGTAASTAPAGNAVKISIGHICSEAHSLNVSCVKFKEFIEKESGGSMMVDIFPNAVLGGDVQMTESVALGTLTMCVPSASTMTMYSKKFGVLSMPYLFSSPESAFEAVDGPLGELLNKEFATVGVTNLGYNFNGIRNMTNNTRPITTPDDLKGIKMRVMESPVFIDMFNSYGANPTPMSFNELFTGLQQGTVDGQENPASLIFESKFNEVQKYLSITEHEYDFCTVLINTAFYEGLPAEQRAILDSGVKQYLIDYQRELEMSQNEEYITKLDESGMEVNRVAPEEKVKFEALTAPMYEKYAETYGADIMAIVDQYRGK